MNGTVFARGPAEGHDAAPVTPVKEECPPEEVPEVPNGLLIRLCLPAGIGDCSWVYSKIGSLSQLTGYPVVVHLPKDEPRRGGEFLKMAPNILWGGYLEDRDSWDVISQAAPADWLSHMGVWPWRRTGILNLSCNIHLEQGRTLADFMPALPTDYHYPLQFSEEDEREAAAIMEALPRPCLAVYVSNRDKDRLIPEGWALWNAGQWAWTLEALAGEGVRSFVFLGAEYDRDKSTDVVSLMQARGFQVGTCLGRPLGTALACLRDADFGIAFPSGIGIMMNVLRTPGLMLLPNHLKGMEQSYADPEDLRAGTYRAWTNPAPREAVEWFRGLIR